MELNELIIIRGGGDLATGVIQKFFRAGFRVLVLESPRPTAIRRTVALSEAVYHGLARVEDMTARLVTSADEMKRAFASGEVPLVVDPDGHSIAHLSPACVVDAIIAKKNLGTRRDMAPVTIAVGPGFCAGRDVGCVIESMRGHDLGRLIFEGSARPNTGTPGEIGGKSRERVIHAHVPGVARHVRAIGDAVEAGEVIAAIDEAPVHAPIAGLLRGLIAEGLTVPQGLKMADIDPRANVDWRTISDKARAIGGGALEAYLYLRRVR